MLNSIQVHSPKKIVKLDNEDGRKNKENEKEEYLITDLAGNNKNMPSLIIRIPSNINKFLSKEEVKIKYDKNISLPTDNLNNGLSSFKIDSSPFTFHEDSYSTFDPKIDLTYPSDTNISFGSSTIGSNLIRNMELKNDIYIDNTLNIINNEDNYDNDEFLLKDFKKNYVEKYEANACNDSIEFLREHTKKELEHFLKNKKHNICDEMKINDIINIDYDKINEKNIIPYFLTNMFDQEQKKKREKMKLQLEHQRKIMMEKKRNERVNKKNMNKETRLKKKMTKNRNLKEEETENLKEKTKTKGTDSEISEEEEEEDSEDYDNYIDESDKELDINIYNDPTKYGIEGSSDYSEGMKSEGDNSQDDENPTNDQSNNTNLKNKKSKKQQKNENSNNYDEEDDETNETSNTGAKKGRSKKNENIEDIVDSSIQKLISYDYYSSLNIKETIKPSDKIKSLSAFIPTDENLDNYDQIKKLKYLINNLPHTHIKEKRSLYHYNIKQFIKWKVYLLNNINICLYGIGSKYHLLNLFSDICLNDGNKCIILGFEEEINLEEIIIRILEYHYKHKTTKKLKSFELLYELTEKVNESNIPLYFVIHNLDNAKLYPYYDCFSFLSQYNNIYFICTIDDVSFELNINFKNVSSINFHYMKCHTWIDYRHEILRQWNKFLPEWVFNKKCEQVDVKKNIETILSALSINHKRLFKIIASMQLENLEKGIFGVEKELLLQDKRVFTVGASSIRINSLLVEFVSHNVITETRLKEGNTFLKINVDNDELKRIVDTLQ
ncbi:origin recognition complex subunit 2, putative [Plasmodium vinckei vinckei]|uniref:Origin recognition complex subunit 2, putative n=1 Tax=Plasmodium vinckei vinckei TaxID=54757 RepID=A0A449BTC5_PLAVN|nr:origin recognition complex subunit 2, putative [Plasmodium vinckei vinckei]KEG02902.1 origin recognition complex subunit 2 [Plasmodium vinckei vinckei]VEV56704.1 origin recognition complex subunit 2, putative [Plasmodium vinckei vinckei]